MSAAALKKVGPYLQRAEELESVQPVVSYYCRVYALDILGTARANGGQSPELDTRLIAELGKAEGQKKTLDLSQGGEVTEGFALQVFEAADAKDRAGTTDEASKKQFYVAGLFLDVCAQFYKGELPPDLAEKAKYGKFRALQIADCIKRGVDPSPEKPPEAAAKSAEEDEEEAAMRLLMQGSAVPTAAAAAPAAAAPAPQAAASSSLFKASGGPPGGLSKEQARADAKRKCEFAAGALDFSDVASARRFLLEGLQLLGG